MSDTESQIRKLRLFINKADELEEFYNLTNGFRSRMILQWTKEEDIPKTQYQGPNVHIFRSFLLTFRQFLLANEPIRMEHIYNLIECQISSHDMRDYVRESRGRWKSIQKKCEFQFILNDEPITPCEMADLWLHGYYFHSDLKKTAKLKAICGDPHITNLAQMFFDKYVTNSTIEILCLRDSVKIALQENHFR